MPAWRQLSARDPAAVLTYIRNSWGNNADAVAETTVSKVRAEVGGRTQSFTADALEAIERTLPDRSDGSVADAGDPPAEDS